jgi:Txe/YoeB family toxin of Txe-Axe toxin-antitoxin module
MSITASEARRRLFPLIEEVNSDRIAEEHRLVYLPTEAGLIILQARYHYSD